MKKLLVLCLLTIGCSKAKMHVVNEPTPVVPSPGPAPAPVVCPAPPKIQLYECKNKHGQLVLQIYATSILKHSCSKDLKCAVKH